MTCSVNTNQKENWSDSINNREAHHDKALKLHQAKTDKTTKRNEQIQNYLSIINTISRKKM